MTACVFVRYRSIPDRVGKFNDPPRLSDLDALELLESDVRDLRNCRPGDCELQLSENTMAQFDARVDWDSADAPAQATRIYREMIFDALRTYRVGGVDTLGTPMILSWHCQTN